MAFERNVARVARVCPSGLYVAFTCFHMYLYLYVYFMCMCTCGCRGVGVGVGYTAGGASRPGRRPGDGVKAASSVMSIHPMHVKEICGSRVPPRLMPQVSDLAICHV